jgi:hypothetical protein
MTSKCEVRHYDSGSGARGSAGSSGGRNVQTAPKAAGPITKPAVAKCAPASVGIEPRNRRAAEGPGVIASLCIALMP